MSGLNASILVWHTCASVLSGWVLYRQLEFTKLTHPDCIMLWVCSYWDSATESTGSSLEFLWALTQLLRWLTFTYTTMNHPSWKPLPRKVLELLKKFNNTSRFIDDLTMLNNDGYLQQFKERIYPKELVLNQENKDNRGTFLDLEAHIKDGKFYIKTYDKREAFNFESSTILISLGTYPNDQPMAYTSPKLYVMPRYVTKPRISSTESDYSSTNCAKNVSPKNGCWQPWRNVAGRTLGLWKNTAMGWTIIWPMIVGALIHEAGTVIQALKPVCQFMAEDIPPPILIN